MIRYFKAGKSLAVSANTAGDGTHAIVAGTVLFMIDMMRFDMSVQGTQQDPDNQNNQNRDAQDFEDDH